MVSGGGRKINCAAGEFAELPCDLRQAGMAAGSDGQPHQRRDSGKCEYLLDVAGASVYNG